MLITDLLHSILLLVNQHENSDYKVEISYKRVVKPEGNKIALEMMNDVFCLRDDWWRGLGTLKNSGLGISDKYSEFDAERQIPVEVEVTKEEKGCICGTILKGLAKPQDCGLFAKVCTPTNPVGTCMVSNEGACHAHYKYNRNLTEL